MDKGIKVYVGLDVHKDTIAVAAAQAGERTAARLIGQIAHDVPKLLKALAKLGQPTEVHVVYEAGPTDYRLQLAQAAKGYRCKVIAPSLIPSAPASGGAPRKLMPYLGLAPSEQSSSDRGRKGSITIRGPSTLPDSISDAARGVGPAGGPQGRAVLRHFTHICRCRNRGSFAGLSALCVRQSSGRFSDLLGDALAFSTEISAACQQG